MPPERSRQLVYELEAFYRSHPMRQKDLANELGLKPQQLSEILALRNRPTGAQILAIQDFLKNNPMSSTPVFDPARTRQKTQPDDALMDYMSTEKHASWAETRDALSAAQGEVTRLRAKMQSMGNPDPVAPKPPAATPPPAPAVVKPATPSPATVTNPHANLSTDDLLANLKEARAWGDADRVSLLQAELHSRVVTHSSNERSSGTLVFDSKDPKTWTGKIGVNAFPSGCDNPKAIGEYLSTLSTEALRGHLKGSSSSSTEQLQQKLAFAELQNRKRSN
jgi:hypothetical protein